MGGFLELASRACPYCNKELPKGSPIHKIYCDDKCRAAYGRFLKKQAKPTYFSYLLPTKQSLREKVFWALQDMYEENF